MTKPTTTDAKVHNTGAANAQGDTEQRDAGQQSLFDLVAEFGGADDAEDITDLEGFIDAISQAETAYEQALEQDAQDTHGDPEAEASFAQAEALANGAACDCDACDCDTDAPYTDVRITRIVIDPAAIARKVTRGVVGVLAIGSIGYLIGVRASNKA